MTHELPAGLRVAPGKRPNACTIERGELEARVPRRHFTRVTRDPIQVAECEPGTQSLRQLRVEVLHRHQQVGLGVEGIWRRAIGDDGRDGWRFLREPCPSIKIKDQDASGPLNHTHWDMCSHRNG